MIHTWRATSNGLEAIALFHNDCILCLDEMGQVNSKEIGEIIYMLANNTGKSRANSKGYAQSQRNWRLIVLSSGEVGIEELMKQAGKKIKAGQQVRIIDISVQKKYGIFEYIYDFQNGADFSRFLSDKSSKYYGVAGNQFIKKIVENLEFAKKRIQKLCDKFIKDNLPLNANGQVQRVLYRFALIAAAGALATEWNIVDWPEEEAFWATADCFQDWIKNRGGLSAQEERNALLQIRHFFELHGDCRFSTFDENTSKTINRAGYVKYDDNSIHFYVFSEVFKNDICNGIDPFFAAKIAIEKGWLIPDSEGKSTRSESLPCSANNTRCYRFDGGKMFSDEL